MLLIRPLTAKEQKGYSHAIHRIPTKSADQEENGRDVEAGPGQRSGDVCPRFVNTGYRGCTGKRAGNLAAHLKTRPLSVEQIETIQEFAARVGKTLEAMDDDFDAKRGLIEALDVRATMVVEDELKAIYARCLLGEDSFLTSRTFQGIVQPL